MQIKSLHCLWLLGNVDESILKLNGILKHGFEVIEIDIMDEKFKTLKELERLDNPGIYNRLNHDYDCLRYSKVYGIQNVFDVPVDKSNMVRFDKIEENDSAIIRDYVPSFVCKIRLFKEGNLRLPVSYQYFKSEDNEIRLHIQERWLRSEFSNEFMLKDIELQKLKNFMKDLVIPFGFNRNFLQTSFGLFDSSYYTFNYDIKALLLFMSLEVLFKSDKHCNSLCIAENIASFFGNDQSYEKIYCEIFNLWKTRNDIAHEGSSGLNQHQINEIIKNLRKYVRKSIVKMDSLGENKDKIIEDLQGKFEFKKIDCTK